MNYARLALASAAAFVAYMGMGGAFFAIAAMKAEFMKYPSVYRSADAMTRVMPVGMLGVLLSMGALAVLFAMVHPSGAGWKAGATFGCIVAVYSLGSFVLHNYMNLNIGSRLAAQQAVAHSLQWIIVGVVIALVYRP